MVKISADRSINYKHRAKVLVNAVRKTNRLCYAPYSKIRVGAGLLGASGKIYTGVNIENCSYSLSICAERVAVYRAYAEGERDFRIMLVWSPQVDFIMPCGACLQVLDELAPGIVIATMNGDEDIKFYPLATLIKQPFRP